VNSGNHKIIRLTIPEAEAAASVLARAFLDDPLPLYLFPTTSTIKAQLYNFILRNVEHALLKGQVYLASPQSGAAAWLFPGDPDIPGLPIEKDPRIKLTAEMDKGSFDRLGLVTKATGRLHREAVQGSHFYLLFLGVDPSLKRTGVGSALLQDMTARADAKGLPCYLETMKEENLAFYSRHGFQVAAEELVDGRLRGWGLLRPPK
jgi:ribosomal protein S18 acetylase RimI-like enzyme